MAEVVICCAGEDRETARRLEAALTRAGYGVWWDEAAADDFWHSDSVVERIRDSRAAIALWSHASAGSGLFRAEANAARAQNKLIQASVDGRSPPTPFDALPAVSLTGWRGEEDHGGWRAIVAALAERCGRVTGRALTPVATSVGTDVLELGSPEAPRLRLPVPATRKLNSSRLVDAMVPALVIIAVGAAATGWMNSQAVANGEGARATAAAAISSASAVQPAEARPLAAPESAPTAAPLIAPHPAPAAAPVPDPMLEEKRQRLLAIGSAALAADAPAATETRAERRPKRSSQASASRRKLLAERRPARPKVKYKYSENMRLFCQRAGAATPECRIFRRNTVRRRRA